MNYSVLQKFKKKNIFYDPFPHIIIRDCLPQNLYSVLSKNYPYNLVSNNGNNRRGSILSNQFEELKCEDWKNFINYHNSIKFLDEIVDIFKDYLKNDQNLLNILNIEIKKKNFNAQNKNITFSSTIDYNTSVTSENSVRGFHIDKPTKFFSGLFYLREEQDNSSGGDLNIFSIKKAKILKTIKYDKNVLVLFINNKYSYHGVTTRSLTNSLRRFCFLSANINSFKHKRINKFNETLMLKYFKYFSK